MKIQHTLVLGVALLLSSGIYAETLLIDADAAAPPNNQQGLLRPGNGLSMDKVQQGFGQPNEVMESIGQPPITRWVYPQYTVYFEHDRVITCVVHR